MSTSVLDLPVDAIAALCRRYHVTELSIFGSALRDDFRPDSDLDFLVSFEEDAPVGLFEYVELQLALSDLLGRKVDLVSKDGLKPLIRDDVIASSRIVYAA
jgi:uncharacterized protein